MASKSGHNTLSNRRVLFARIGWMRFYKGAIPGDDRLFGGGAYNEGKIGSEVSNFADLDGKLYGFVQTSGDLGVNIHRLGGAGGAQWLRNALVIFIARSPSEGGQRIIGWYRNAMVSRIHQTKRGRPHSPYYTAIGRIRDAVLLPTWNRTYTVPVGTGAMGQSNVCYPLASDGSSKWRRWMADAVKFVHAYEGPNLLKQPNVEADSEISSALELVLSQSAGQGIRRHRRGAPSHRPIRHEARDSVL
jgi:hypothetical protein